MCSIDLFLDHSFAHLGRATEVTLVEILQSLKQILAELCYQQ